MTTNVVLLKKYIADEGKVFDWKVPHYIDNEDGTKSIDHLYAKQLFLSETDDISNYKEIDKPEEV